MIIGVTALTAFVSFAIPAVMITSVKFAITAAIMVYFGVFMAVLNSGVCGYVSQVGDQSAVSSYMVGCSLNAIIILIVQIFCIAALPDNPDQQAIVYFVVTGCILLFACFCFHKLTLKFPI